MAYGGTLYIGTKFSGTPHFNFLLTIIPAVPSNLLYLLLPDRLGRRNTLILCELPIGIGLGIDSLIQFLFICMPCSCWVLDMLKFHA